MRCEITQQIRRWRPDLIITLNPQRTYNNFPGWHRDHRITGRVVMDCLYPLARDHRAFPEQHIESWAFPSRPASATLAPMSLFTDLRAFAMEHERCGELDGRVEGDRGLDDVHVRGAD